MSPEMRPKSFGTFEKRAPELLKRTLLVDAKGGKRRMMDDMRRDY